MRTGVAFTVSPDDQRRLEAIVADPERQTKIRLARTYYHRKRARTRHHGNHATNRQVQKLHLAMAKTRYARRRGRPAPRRYPTARPGQGARLQGVRRFLELTMSPPDGEATHWTLRAMAARVGLAFSTVRAIWQKHGLAPHRLRLFKLSTDPAFVDKLQDVMGLYVNPPDHAIVMSVDEKSQIQAMGRTQTPLPMTQGRPETRTHDYQRNGTTTLFAALNTLDGTAVGQTMERHWQQEFITFLDTIERQLPSGREVHVILDKLQHAQDPRGSVLACFASELDVPFHPHVVFMVECGRGVCEVDETPPSGCDFRVGS